MSASPTASRHASAVWLLYTNHRGETAWRHVRPDHLWFDTAPPWHPEPQWLLGVQALDRGGALRTFAMANVLRWQVEAPADLAQAEDPLGRLAQLEAWRDAVVARSIAAGRRVPGEGLCDWFEELADELKLRREADGVHRCGRCGALPEETS